VSLVSVPDVPDVLDLSAVVEGREPAGVDWSTADNLVRQHIDPISDIQATAEYRSALACELAHRALAAATAQAADPAQGIHPNGLLPADRAQGIHPNGELPAGGGA
jgi:hypothetical protein